jgi:hypothetical protein
MSDNTQVSRYQYFAQGIEVSICGRLGAEPEIKTLDNGNRVMKLSIAYPAGSRKKEDGTYELIGEKVQGNPEKIDGHKLVKHGSEILDINDFTFDVLKRFLTVTDVEGIVFHHKENDLMCKIRKSDFGIKR